MDAVTAMISGLLLGLASSPHCLALCGGIAAAAPALAGPAGGPGNQIAAQASLNAGRVLSYAMLGLAAGSVGMSVLMAFDAAGLRAVFRGLSAVFILWLGLSLAGIGDGMRLVHRGGGGMQGLMRRCGGTGCGKPLFAFGMVWGAMPCAMVYSALMMAAMTGGMLPGAAHMAGFGLATVPALMLGAWGLRAAHAFGQRSAVLRVRRAAGLGIAVIGLLSLAAAAPGLRDLCL